MIVQINWDVILMEGTCDEAIGRGTIRRLLMPCIEFVVHPANQLATEISSEDILFR